MYVGADIILFHLWSIQVCLKDLFPALESLWATMVGFAARSHVCEGSILCAAI